LLIGGWARLSVLLKKRGLKNDLPRPCRAALETREQGGHAVGQSASAVECAGDASRHGDATYLDYARRSVESLLSQQATNGNHRGAFGDYGELSAGALASFALAQPNGEITPRINAR
jgi:hypothetical protein